MALFILGVLLLGGLAAAADDNSVVWWTGWKPLALPCRVPDGERLHPPRRAPLPIDDDQPPRRDYWWTFNGTDINPERILQNGSLLIGFAEFTNATGVAGGTNATGVPGGTNATGLTGATSGTNATGVTGGTNASAVTDGTNATGENGSTNVTAATAETGGTNATGVTGSNSVTGGNNATAVTGGTNATAATGGTDSTYATGVTGGTDVTNATGVTGGTNVTGAVGFYQCAARHGSGLVLGYPVKLKYAYIEKKFSQHPETKTARIGQPVTLSCFISSAPRANISWLKNGGMLPKDERFHQLTNQLLITDVRKKDAGSYGCLATNPHTHAMIISENGQLSVERSSEDLEPGWLPLLVERQLVVERGAGAVLPCPVVAWPRREIVWQLTPPGGRTGELDTVDQVLVMPQVELDQEGVYTCRVTGVDHLVQSFNVTISEPIVIQPARSPPNLSFKKSPRASTFRVNCTATGRPEPSMTWYKDGKPLAISGRRKLLVSEHGYTELVINSITSDDAGVYQCFVSNNITSASVWAALIVTGPRALAPANVTCAPLAARAVALRWTHERRGSVMAYTVHTTRIDGDDDLALGQPLQHTHDTIQLEEALTPYRFQVRAYMFQVASDMSASIICQGQGVPIKLYKLSNDEVSISWSDFAQKTPGVQKWMVQYKEENGEEKNVTLSGEEGNYTLKVPPEAPLLVRVLGSRSKTWLQQNLTLVPWTSTERAGDDLDDSILSVLDLQLTSSSADSATLTWRCPASEDSSQTFSFYICAKIVGAHENQCHESSTSSATLRALQPGAQYDVRVQARRAGRALGGPFSPPLRVYTMPAESARFKDLKYEFLNSSMARVSWGEGRGEGRGGGRGYSVKLSTQLKLPVSTWRTEAVLGNEALIPILNPAEDHYVMVTDLETQENSRIVTIKRQSMLLPDANVRDKINVTHIFTWKGLQLTWNGSGTYRVRYTQNITAPIEQWSEVNVTSPEVLLSNLDRSKKTYVVVLPPGADPNHAVLTVPAAPEEASSLYLIVGGACGAALLCLLVVAALCFWRRRKRNRSPLRSRRRRASASASEDEGAEMTDVGGRLANGGAPRGAGEPLLNGHVRITENPAQIPKTPNGKRKNVTYAAFDVARYDAAAADAAAPGGVALGDAAAPGGVALGAAAALLDDNMNARDKVVRVRARQKDSSQPTLQPNG